MATVGEGSVVDTLKEAAGKVSAKVSEVVGGAQQYFNETAEKLKSEGQSYAGAVKEQASKAKEMASRAETAVADKAHSLADRASAAADSTAAKVEEAADRTAGKANDMAAVSVEKIDVEMAAGRAGTNIGTLPAGTLPLNAQVALLQPVAGVIFEQTSPESRMGRGTQGDASTWQQSEVGPSDKYHQRSSQEGV
ncbi:hypothetical protein HaLaN_00780 [Haematococcus lacustris]|uniref:Uncharacterized protein n=1 Tax=Haematococcus lacustris TaxID=44745 RepID=A0A699Y7M8_HAELA|nr:hypothetical protein HaLaN_00780 [Haematococcus lacustris]